MGIVPTILFAASADYVDIPYGPVHSSFWIFIRHDIAAAVWISGIKRPSGKNIHYGYCDHIFYTIHDSSNEVDDRDELAQRTISWSP